MLQTILPAVRRRRGGSGARFPTPGRMLLVVLAGLLAVSSTLDGAVRPTPLDYEMHTLDNGLRVVLSEDHSTPIVHLQMVYHVGSKNERPGRTGFAHLFEHMMFKGSKNVLPDSHLTMISRVGGDGNAYTTEDATTYLQTVPSQYLPLVLWLEADRMATLRIDQRTFEAEREVVKEERRWRYEDAPFGLLTEILYDQAYTVHPYKHSVIGSMEDLEAASIEDVQDFYDTYYVPENATLVLVGDFDPVQALAHIKLYFGRVPKAKQSGAPRHPPRAAVHRGAPGDPDPVRELAPARGHRGPSHHLRRAPRRVSPAHRDQGALGRGELAHLPPARLRGPARGVGGRRRPAHRGPEPLLRGVHRPAGPHAGRVGGGRSSRSWSG